MPTSSRDGHIHSFAHVIPACRLAGWLVVIGAAAERAVMPPCARRAQVAWLERRARPAPWEDRGRFKIV
jgi:hypothetical protein